MTAAKAPATTSAPASVKWTPSVVNGPSPSSAAAANAGCRSSTRQEAAAGRDPRDRFGHLGRSFLPDGAVRLEHDRAHDDDAWRPRLGPLEQLLVVAGQAHEPLRPAPAAADLGCVPGAHHGVVGPDPDEGAVDRLEPLVAQPGEEVRHRVAGAPPVEQPVLREPPVEQREVGGAGPPLGQAVSQEDDQHGQSLRRRRPDATSPAAIRQAGERWPSPDRLRYAAVGLERGER